MASALFEEFSVFLEQESEVKEEIRLRVREVDQTGREINLILSKIHQSKTREELLKILDNVEKVFQTKVRDSFAKLAKAVPKGQFFRYHQFYCFSIQRYVFYAALTVYLKDEKLIEKKDAAQWLGIDESGDFFLDLEDYLSGLTQLSNELSRFSVNAVTHGDYSWPKRIAEFLNVLLTGFRLLNLKNDGLRKKFDSLKYDMKKVEEVVYDLSIRGLLKDLTLEDPTTEAQTDSQPEQAAKE